MYDPKGNNDDSSKKNEDFVSAIGFHHNSGTSFTRNSDWIIDKGATDHITYDRYKFDQLSSKCSINTVTNANRVSSPIVGIGIVPLSPSLTLKDVLFILSLSCNLISIK